MPKYPAVRSNQYESRLGSMIAAWQTAPDACWIWPGSINAAGYGELTWRKRPKARAHRVLYEILVGPVPAGLELDHLCRQRACVNPRHLEAVTHAENLRRGAGNGYRDHTHCKHGHEFTPENTRLRDRGTHTERVCRTCVRIDGERRRHARAKRPVHPHGSTHCRYGHEYTPENTYYRTDSRNARRCRACKADEHQRNYQRRKLAKSARTTP